MAKSRVLVVGLLGIALVLAFAIACGGNATATPAPTKAPAATAAPTSAPAATAVPTPTKAAAPTQPAADAPVYGGTLRYARNLDAKTFDTTFDINAGSRAVAHIWLDNLVDITPDLVLVPRLAQSWSVSPDGKAITLKLIQGAKFSDGTDFDGSAVKGYMDRVLDPKVQSNLRGDVATISNITVPDKYTVTLNLSQPNRTMLATLADYPGFIHSIAAINKYNSYADRTGEYGKRPTGTGPFVLTQYIPDSQIVADKNTNYWDKGRPYLDKVIYQHVPDTKIQLTMLRTGETDLIDLVNASDFPLIRANPNIKMAQIARGRIHFIGLSWEYAPWDKKALRQAFAYGVDRNALANIYHLGAAEPAYSAAIGWAYNPNIKIYDSNPTKAKEKMVEAGYPNGLTVDYPCNNISSDIERCEMIQAQLKLIGLNMNIQPVIPSDYFPNIVARKIHVAHRWRGPRGDPAIVLEQTFMCKGSGTVMGYCNPKVDGLLTQAGAIYDTAQAKQLYDQAQTIIVDDVAAVLTVFTKETNAYNAKLQNYEFIPDLYLRSYKLWLKK